MLAGLAERFDLILNVLEGMFESLPPRRIGGSLRKNAFPLQVQGLLAPRVLGPLLLRNPTLFFSSRSVSVAGFQLYLLRGSRHLFLH
jgi:hypothetical protein